MVCFCVLTCQIYAHFPQSSIQHHQIKKKPRPVMNRGWRGDNGPLPVPNCQFLHGTHRNAPRVWIRRAKCGHRLQIPAFPLTWCGEPRFHQNLCGPCVAVFANERPFHTVQCVVRFRCWAVVLHCVQVHNFEVAQMFRDKRVHHFVAMLEPQKQFVAGVTDRVQRRAGPNGGQLSAAALVMLPHVFHVHAFVRLHTKRVLAMYARAWFRVRRVPPPKWF